MLRKTSRTKFIKHGASSYSSRGQHELKDIPKKSTATEAIYESVQQARYRGNTKMKQVTQPYGI